MSPPYQKVLVTGPHGFVGTHLCSRLEKGGYSVVRAVRHIRAPGDVLVGDLESQTDWTGALTGCDAVIHLAARVHVMRETADHPLDAFRQANVTGTLRLAHQAAQAGVNHFLFMSSLKVNGEAGHFTENDSPAPQDPYGISKWEAEQGLHELSARTGMRLTVLRPPLVYGPGVGGNFLRLMQLVRKGVPLPLGAIHNERSLVYVGNLVDAALAALNRPAQSKSTYFVTDGAPVSTTELIRQMANAFGVPTRLISIPDGLIHLLANGLGQGKVADRLLGSLTASSDALCRDLHWAPPTSLKNGLESAAQWYLNSSSTAVFL